MKSVLKNAKIRIRNVHVHELREREEHDMHIRKRRIGHAVYRNRSWNIGGEAASDGWGGSDQKDRLEGVSHLFSASGLVRAEAGGVRIIAGKLITDSHLSRIF